MIINKRIYIKIRREFERSISLELINVLIKVLNLINRRIFEDI